MASKKSPGKKRTQMPNLRERDSCDVLYKETLHSSIKHNYTIGDNTADLTYMRLGIEAGMRECKPHGTCGNSMELGSRHN